MLRSRVVKGKLRQDVESMDVLDLEELYDLDIILNLMDEHRVKSQHLQMYESASFTKGFATLLSCL